MSGIVQNFAYGRDFGFPNGWPANIGDAYQGGYFAGQINVSGTKYNLVVAPKASGESFGLIWGPATGSGFNSVINGPGNSAGEAALGSSYAAATFCEGLTIGGFTDWYLPATNELEVLYYYLKPTTTSNTTSPATGSNPNAVLPEPISTNYTSSAPSQTKAAIFKTGGSEAFSSAFYYSSTEDPINFAHVQLRQFNTGTYATTKQNDGPYYYTRAIRRVLA